MQQHTLEQAEPKRLFTLDEAARILSVTRRTLEREKAEGRLSTVGLRGRVLVPDWEINRIVGGG